MRFVTYAIKCRLAAGPLNPVRLKQTAVDVATQPFIQVDEVWTEWLGRFYADHFRESNLHLLAMDAPDDNAPLAASARIGNVYQSLWLHGLLAIDRAEAVNGPHSPGEALRADGTLDLHVPTWETWRRTWPVLDTATLDSVDRVAMGLGTRNLRGPEFRRLWHGLHMLLRGLQEQIDGFERSACLIRSLEAIVFEPDIKGLGAKDFGQRGAAFLLDHDATKLSACYTKLRNAALHMHDRQMIEKDPNAKKELDALGQLAESLTLHVWREILGRPEVLESVSDARLPDLQRQLKAGEAGAWLGARFEPPKPPA